MEAAIAAVHAEACTPEATDWRQICALQGAAAVAMHEGHAAGLVLIEALFTRGELRDYHLAHSARANLFRQLGRRDEARAAYERAHASEIRPGDTLPRKTAP